MGWVALAGAAVGAIAGSQPKRSSSSSTSSINVGADTELGTRSSSGLLTDYDALRQTVDSQALSGKRAESDWIAMLESFSKGGFLPSEADIGTTNQFARDIFAGQQTALDQGFEDEQTRMQRLAAQLGRPINDPILQAKFAQEKTRQQQMLEAQKTGFVAQEARNLPLMRAQFQEQLANRAVNNRMTLLNLGSQLQAGERNWRLATASRSGTQTVLEGGGLQGALTGAIGGASIGSMFGGGGMSTGQTVGAGGGQSALMAPSAGRAANARMQPTDSQFIAGRY